MSILVTGATGLVGSHLLVKLAETDQPIYATYRNKDKISGNPVLKNLPSDRITWLEGDITDVIFLDDILKNSITQVYHTAAMVSFYPPHRKAMWLANEQGTARLVNACLEAGVKKLVHVSSIATLGKPENEQRLINETDNWKDSPDNSNYAITKFRAECEVFRGSKEGLTVAVVNPSVILGPGNWSDGSARLIKTVADGLKYYTTGRTGFVDVRDVADAMIALMNSEISDERFILNGHNLSWQHVFTLLANALGVKAPSVCPPRWQSEIAWRFLALKALFSGKEPLITKETTHSAYKEIEFDGSKITRAIPGFSYRSLEDTISYTTRMYR